MNTERKYSPIDNFDFSLLDDPEYGEDSVREDIISPIIKALGYSASGDNKMVRSRKLKHPYVSIGSLKKEIHIIPDYVMEVQSKPAWILEAKGPTHKLLNTKHVEQAYSYAIHPEIRAQYYCLCNGREFLLYDIEEYEPIFHFDMRLLPSYWESLNQILNPKTLNQKRHKKLVKDYGLHLKRMGISSTHKLFYLDFPFPFIAKLNNNLYTTAIGIEEGDTYQASLDFSHEVFLKLKGKISDEVFDLLEEDLSGSMVNVNFNDIVYHIAIECHLGDVIEENDQELFLPLVATNVL